MATRYATIVRQDDGTEVISNISVMEGGKPDVRSGNSKVEKVADDVKIGMIRGGKITPVGDWGFPGDPKTPGASNQARANEPDKEGKATKPSDFNKDEEVGAAKSAKKTA